MIGAVLTDLFLLQEKLLHNCNSLGGLTSDIVAHLELKFESSGINC